MCAIVVDLPLWGVLNPFCDPVPVPRMVSQPLATEPCRKCTRGAVMIMAVLGLPGGNELSTPGHYGQ